MSSRRGDSGAPQERGRSRSPKRGEDQHRSRSRSPRDEIVHSRYPVDNDGDGGGNGKVEKSPKAYSSPGNTQPSGNLNERQTPEITPTEHGEKPGEKSPKKDGEEEIPSEQPNFGLSGKLAAETNTYNGVTIEYVEPSEARKPVSRWRLYVFKGNEHIDMLHIHRQSAYLLGKDRRVADIPIDHPSCSKQHAVIQFRLMIEQTPVGQASVKPSQSIKPFIIDLNSTNGTFVNDTRVPPSRYYELRAKDTIRFACSTREYVLIREEDANLEGNAAAARSQNRQQIKQKIVEKSVEDEKASPLEQPDGPL